MGMQSWLLKWLNDLIPCSSTDSLVTIRDGKRRISIGVLGKIAAAILVLCYLIWYFSSEMAATQGKPRLWSLCITILYLVASYFIHPRRNFEEPDIAEQSLKTQDDLYGSTMSSDLFEQFKRFVLPIYLVLWPGRFVSTTLIETSKMAFHKWPKADT